jgi:hypothetical protein
MSLLPVLMVFTGLTFQVILSQLTSWNLPERAGSLFQLGIIGVLLWCSFSSFGSQAYDFSLKRGDSVIQYIQSHSSPDDSVLLWGAQSSINFFAGRKSPTRFVYQLPLYNPYYADEEMILEFLGDISRNRPRLIIDARDPATPIFYSVIQSQAINAAMESLKTSYHVVDNLGDWTVYEYSGGAH